VAIINEQQGAVWLKLTTSFDMEPMYTHLGFGQSGEAPTQSSVDAMFTAIGTALIPALSDAYDCGTGHVLSGMSLGPPNRIDSTVAAQNGNGGTEAACTSRGSSRATSTPVAGSARR
jgi:hypothetical protein